MNRWPILFVTTMIAASIGIACSAVWQFESTPTNSQFREFDGVLRVPGNYLAPWNTGFKPLLDEFRSGKYELEIFDSDGDVWSEFSFGGHDSEIETVADSNVDPFAFHKDYDLLDFRITRVSNTWIEIIVNENTKERKFVRGYTSAGVFTWDQYFKRRSAVDTLDQWIHDRPAGDRILKPEYSVYEVKPIEVRGDWLKVRCLLRNSLDSGFVEPISAADTIEGWVKWRNGDEILISIFHFA